MGVWHDKNDNCYFFANDIDILRLSHKLEPRLQELRHPRYRNCVAADSTLSLYT